jgi:hypothetical protein
MEKAKGKAFECSIAGTWRVGDTGFTNFVPLDPTGRKFSILTDGPLPEDPTVFGFFPKATALTPTRGMAVKVSRNLFKFTVTQIAVDEYGDKLGEFEVSGDTKFIDCDQRVLSYSFKIADAEGEEIYCGVGTGSAERFKIVPPCDELLPFSEIPE